MKYTKDLHKSRRYLFNLRIMAQYLRSKGVSFIRFTNPPVNSLSLAVRDGILKGIEQAKIDKCSALVLCGDGKNFSAGADIKEFARRKHLAYPSLNEVSKY
jgi:enoyl-CoA hydratase/carnithine racemase